MRLKFIICLPLLTALSASAQAVDDNPFWRKASADANAVCQDVRSCLETVMQAASRGNRSDELAAMERLFTLREDRQKLSGALKRPGMGGETLALGNADTTAAGVLKNAMEDLDSMTELGRPVVKALLLANKPDQAVVLLQEMLASLPSATPFWLEFAAALAATGRDDSAVSALVVAHSWAREPALLLQAYEKAAQQSAPMNGIYGQAVATINANTGAWERKEAAAAPLSADPRMRAVASFSGCVRPYWPRGSIRFSESGSVTMTFLIDGAGKVIHAKVAQSSSHFELDHLALVRVSRCPFSPSRGGDPAALRRAQMQYVWALE
jgi:TonB family protein